MTELEAFQFALPMNPPPVAAIGPFRRGLLICKPSSHGRCWSEASPLPGFSAETLDEVIEAFRGGDFQRFPSLRFAIDSLRFQDTTPIRETFVQLAALSIDDQADPKALTRLGELRHSAVKLKVARHADVDEDIRWVKQVRACLRPNQRLRLDANRTWNFEQAREFARGIKHEAIEFIEEPTYETDTFEKLYTDHGLRYALDETLREDVCLDHFPHASAFIIKPTLMGGRADWQAFLGHGVPCVISASFESGVGIFHLARLAAEFTPHVPAGLDTYRWLGTDLLGERFVMESGRLAIAESVTVCPEFLQRIPR